jgi:glycosyltransferase involved in cell wall biosynthesis
LISDGGTTLNKYKTLIIDFNASKRYSHHWYLVQQYKQFLLRFKTDYEIWIPENAHKDVIQALGKNCYYILKSNYHGYERKQNFFKWSINKSIDIFFDFTRKKIRWVANSEITKKLLAHYYIYRPFINIKKIIKLGYKVDIIFPSADTLAVRLVEKCLQNGLEINRVCLRLPHIYKDSLSFNDMESTLQKLVNDFPNCDFALGYETVSLKKLLKLSGIRDKNLFWSPAPPIQKPGKKTVFEERHPKTNSSLLTFAFLGAARPGKGFEDIPRLISLLGVLNLQFKVFIQQAVYSWPEYEITMEQLKTFPTLIEFLPSDLSQDHLEQILQKIDILLLPYKEKDYKIAGSALFFLAAEYGIPTLTKTGVSFAWDIETYQLGSTYKGDEEFVAKMRSMMSYSEIYNFELYNQDRLSAIEIFLGL